MIDDLPQPGAECKNGTSPDANASWVNSIHVEMSTAVSIACIMISFIKICVNGIEPTTGDHCF